MHDRSDLEPRLRSAGIENAEALRAAIDAYEDASMRGLCDEGAFEIAVGAAREIPRNEADPTR